MKPLFYLLTAAAHPFGLYVVVPLYMEHCYVVTGSDGAGRAMAAGFAELFAIALWTLGVVIVSLLVSRLHYKEWLPTIGINTIIILIYLRLLLGLSQISSGRASAEQAISIAAAQSKPGLRHQKIVEKSARRRDKVTRVELASWHLGFPSSMAVGADPKQKALVILHEES